MGRLDASVPAVQVPKKVPQGKIFGDITQKNKQPSETDSLKSRLRIPSRKCEVQINDQKFDNKMKTDGLSEGTNRF